MTMVNSVNEIGCVKAATEIIGDKWTPLLLRFFINEGSARFCQLQDSIEGINPRTLSARLGRLEAENIITKTATTSEARCEYTLTEKGKDLLPIIIDMEAWSKKHIQAC
jgi:DNA-binding HxlR family transcriptional regulator